MDPDQVLRLFQTQHAALEAFVRRFLGRLAPEVEDIKQECFLRLLRYEGPAPNNPKSFLFKVARNLCIDLLRLRKTRGRVEVQGNPDMEDQPIDTPDDRSPQRTWEDREKYDVIEHALQELPAHCRLAFIMVCNDGLDYAQAAERLHVAEGTVRTYVSRAKQHCLAALASYETGRARK